MTATVIQVQQIMRRDFVCAEPDESLEAACQTMRLARLRHLLVTRGDALVGILSYRDLLERMQGFAPRTASIGDAMRRDALCVVGPDSPLGEAADRMCRYGYGCLPVVKGNQLVGLVTEADLLRAAYGLRPS